MLSPMNFGNNNMNDTGQIQVKIIWNEEEYIVTTRRNEYRSLMVLIKDRFYSYDFGLCGGMGRCATCMVRLYAERDIPGMERNETATLSRQGVTDPAIRLSCQLYVHESLHDCTVVVPDGP